MQRDPRIRTAAEPAAPLRFKVPSMPTVSRIFCSQPAEQHLGERTGASLISRVLHVPKNEIDDRENEHRYDELEFVKKESFMSDSLTHPCLVTHP